MRASLTLALLLLAPLAAAFEPLEGRFVASEACPTGRSISGIGDAGEPQTEAGRAYDILGANRREATHYRIRMPDGRDRWVAARCGRHEGPGGDAESTSHVLAASWQPAFCEGEPRRDECRLLNAGDLPGAAGRFSLHGLWPEDTYCPPLGTAHRGTRRWSRLPAPDLTPATRAALERAMPGMRSDLHRHQWIKHGTCHRDPEGADGYYADALQVLEGLNASPVRALFAERTGARLEAGEIRAVFDAAFGRGAGRRVEIDCLRDGRRTLIVELKINLAGRITPERRLSDLILAAPPRRGDCRGGIVDPAGLQ